MFDCGNNFFLIALLTLVGIFLIEYNCATRPNCVPPKPRIIENPMDQRFAVLEEKLDTILDKLAELTEEDVPQKPVVE